MRFLKLVLLFFISYQATHGANGDSIFNIKRIHSLYVTFPYSSFYDSLIKTNTTDLYLNVNVKFNDKIIDSVGIKVKGNSSFNNPSQKKSFKIDFNEFRSKGDVHGLKKLNFNNSFKDPSFMREKVTNDFIRQFNVPAPRVSYCNVYFNNQLWGLYAIVENIDDEFCKSWFGSTDGNLFQGDPKGTLQWKGNATQSLYTNDYDLENNKTANNWSDLIALINTINNTPMSELRNKLDTILNTGAFVKQWVVQNMFASFDAYIGSGHNYYIYHDTITRKFQWIAWDNNEAFGSFKFSLTNPAILATDIFYLNTPTSKPLCDRMLKDSIYKKMYVDSFCMMQQYFSNARLDSVIDSLYAFIKPAVYGDPKKFYTNNDFETNITSDIILTGPGGINVFGLKNFIRDRAVAIKNSFNTNKLTCFSSSALTQYEGENEEITWRCINHHMVFSEPVSIKLFDLMGREMTTKYHTTEFLLNDVDMGSYLLVYEKNGVSKSIHFVK